MLRNFVLVIMEKQEKVKQYFLDIPDDAIQRIVDHIVAKEADSDLTGNFCAEESRSARSVDFRSEVDEQARKNLEAAISRSGLLTALLVSEEDEGRIYELPILRTQQIKTQNLTQYLVAVPNEAMSQSRIERLFQGISIVKSDEAYILDTEEFQNGFIRGNAPFQEEQFIGKAAREATRAKRILSLQADIQSSQNRIAEAEDQIAFLENPKRRLNAELLNFPSLEPMRKVEKQRKDLDTEEKVANIQVEQQEANLQSLKQSNLPTINEFLLKSAPYHRIEPTSTAYQNVLDDLTNIGNNSIAFFIICCREKH